MELQSLLTRDKSVDGPVVGVALQRLFLISTVF